jgi:hypothetical protein
VSKLLACGGAELISLSLSAHGGDEIAVSLVSQIIHSLIVLDVDELDGKNTVQDKLAERGVCEVLCVRALPALPDFGLVSQCAVLRALGSLARKHVANKRRLALNGICEALAKLSIVSPITTSVHVELPPPQAAVWRDASVSECFCWCLANLSLSDGDNQRRLGELGLCEVTTRLITVHTQSAALAQQDHKQQQLLLQEALRALRQLCLNCEDNARRAQQSGIVAALMHLFRQCSEQPDMLQWVLFALSALCAFDLCDAELKREQICAEIIAALAR